MFLSNTLKILFWLKQPYNVVIALCLLLAVLERNSSLLNWYLLGILFPLFLDLILKRIFYKKWIFSKSAIITGLIISGILSTTTEWYLLLGLEAIAISSKYLIRYHARSFINPANLSLLLATIFGIPLTWHIATNNYFIIFVGLYLVWALRKITHTASFILLFSLFLLTQNILPWQYINWFFVFIMLIEPKSSGVGYRRGALFGTITATISGLAYLLNFSEPLILGLFVANSLNPLLNLVKID